MPMPSQAIPARIYSLLLKIRPLAKGTLMPFSGELVHGAWIRWLNEASPIIAQQLHEGKKHRLFTCSSVQFPLSEERLSRAQRENIHLPLNEQQTYTIRITLLWGELFPLLYEIVMRMNMRSFLAESAVIQIGKQRFALDAMISSPDDASGWAGYTTYEELVALAQRQRFSASVPCTFEFASPTTFHRLMTAQRKYPAYYAQLPLPHYIFPGLAKRWQELAPPELTAVIQKEQIETYIADEGIIIDDCHVQTQQVHFTEHVQRGFIGSCRYLMRGPDDAPVTESPLTVRQQLYLLAWFAFYTGVGYKTTMGMGQTRLQPSV
jgi:CRISPR-associated endoribonuclease Cas6